MGFFHFHGASQPSFILTLRKLCGMVAIMEGARQMKRRDLVKQLEASGYQLIRDEGDHTVFQKPNARPVSVPRHREINENTAKAILRVAGLR